MFRLKQNKDDIRFICQDCERVSTDDDIYSDPETGRGFYCLDCSRYRHCSKCHRRHKANNPLFSIPEALSRDGRRDVLCSECAGVCGICGIGERLVLPVDFKGPALCGICAIEQEVI